MSDPIFGLRRDPPHDPDAVGEDAELVARIRAEIAQHGPMTFARFMERALYEPGHGYYRRREPGPGTRGDFLTAPESHPLFGAAIAGVVAEVWVALDRPDPLLIVEHGAGTGALAVGLLDALRQADPVLAGAVRYRPVDVEAARLTTLRERLVAAGLDGALAQTGAAPSVVLANEVLDALPVHRVVMRDRLRELFVVATERGFAAVDGDPSTPALAAHLAADGVVLPDGRYAEIPLALDGWLAGATAEIRHGFVLLVDYGAEAADLHGPARPQGSLRTFARHTVGDDPFVRIGRQDLTTHVDLTALRRAAAALGLEPAGETRQGEFLAASGVGEHVAQRLREPGASLEDAFAMRSALARLLDPRVMGGYRVLGFGRGLGGYVPAALRPLGRFATPADTR